MNMVEIQQRGIEFLRRFQKVGTSYRALGLAETSSWATRDLASGLLTDTAITCYLKAKPPPSPSPSSSSS
jgi:hypothetical protein